MAHHLISSRRDLDRQYSGSNSMDNDTDESGVPFVIKNSSVNTDGGRRGRVFDSLLDKAGYGWFHVILILGQSVRIHHQYI